MTTITPPRALRNPLLIGGSLMAVALLAVLLAAGLATAEEEPDAPDPIGVEMLTERSEFTDDVAVQIRNKFEHQGTDVMNLRDASNIAVAEITIQPGAVLAWHTHPGPVLITIADGDDEGAFVYVLADDCIRREYTPGQALVDAGGDNIHTAYNPSETVTVVIATFLGAPEEGPLTDPIDDKDQAEAFNDACGIDAPVPDGSSHDH